MSRGRPATAPPGSPSYAARLLRHGWKLSELDPDTAKAWRKYRHEIQARARARARGEDV